MGSGTLSGGRRALAAAVLLVWLANAVTAAESPVAAVAPPVATPPAPEGVTTNRLPVRGFSVDFATLRAGFPQGEAAALPTLLSRYLAVAGVPESRVDGWDEPRTVVAGGPPGRALRLLAVDDRSGLLVVRADTNELNLIERALAQLTNGPPLVAFEVRFAVIHGPKLPALGFDWAAPVIPGVTNRDGSPVVLTNAPLELRGDDLDWAGRRVTNAANLRLATTLRPALTAILEPEQFRDAIRALEALRQVDVMAPPRVSTASDRPAEIRMIERRRVVTGINPAAIVRPGYWAATNTPTLIEAEVPVGPVLRLRPLLASDNRSLQLTATPTLTEFLGYEATARENRVRVWRKGVKQWMNPPRPRFRVRQLETRVTLVPGQTLALGTWDEPFVTGGPIGSGTTAAGGGGEEINRLVIFVTPTLVPGAVQPVELPMEIEPGDDAEAAETESEDARPAAMDPEPPSGE